VRVRAPDAREDVRARARAREGERGREARTDFDRLSRMLGSKIRAQVFRCFVRLVLVSETSPLKLWGYLV